MLYNIWNELLYLQETPIINSSQLTTIHNFHGQSRLSLLTAHIFNGRNNVHTGYHFAKDDVFSIEPSR